MLLPGGENEAAFLPANLANPRSREQTGSKMRYFLCWKPVVERLKQTGMCPGHSGVGVLICPRRIQALENQFCV